MKDLFDDKVKRLFNSWWYGLLFICKVSLTSPLLSSPLGGYCSCLWSWLWWLWFLNARQFIDLPPVNLPGWETICGQWHVSCVHLHTFRTHIHTNPGFITNFIQLFFLSISLSRYQSYTCFSLTLQYEEIETLRFNMRSLPSALTSCRNLLQCEPGVFSRRCILVWEVREGVWWGAWVITHRGLTLLWKQHNKPHIKGALRRKWAKKEKHTAGAGGATFPNY